ncbi:7TM diverse intracellular signaling domain-containing protein [uncultured Hoeflea sp.]|uniref:sensor histidine kinase n=1 Tax=uncultured Hoeflea sp. TaxID=538666 RepID=UPI00262E45ED|nr:7TM diverse intracellular signaling domain-containing protein [uncultured Hoeflea sp.]
MRSAGQCLALLVFVATVLLGSGCGSYADEPLTFEQIATGTGAASFEDVCCGSANADRQPGTPDATLATQYGSGPYWIRFTSPATPGVLALTAIVDVAELYIRDPVTGTVRISASGDTLPVSVRDLIEPRLAFILDERDAGAELYMRVVQPTRLSVRFERYELDALVTQERRILAMRLFFIGAIVMIGLFNLVLSVTSRDATFLFNGMTILCLVLLDLYLSGLGAAYIWGAAPWLSNPLLVVAIAGPVIFASGFFRLFLRNPGDRQFWRDRAFVILPVLAALTILMLVALPYWQLQAVSLLLGFLALLHFLAVCLYGVWMREIRSMVLLAPLTLAVIPGMVLVALQKIAGFELGLMENHVLEMTLALEALLFSVALAYRLRLAEKERLASHLKLAAHNKSARKMLLDTIDAERSRISSALHETAGHGFLAITSRIAKMSRSTDLPPATRNELMEIADLSQVLVGELRHISHELHLGALDHLGLARAIELLLERMEAAGMASAFERGNLDEAKLSRAQQVHLFRIVQEVLINVAKHSRASAVEVGLNIDNGSVIVSVRDDGDGFKTDDANRTAGLGMTLIGERADALGASWTVKSTAAGTVFDLQCPLAGGMQGSEKRAEDGSAG